MGSLEIRFRSQIPQPSTQRNSHKKFGECNQFNGDGEAVSDVALEQLVTRFSDQTIDLLKVDIKGAERELFQHADSPPYPLCDY